MTTLDNTNPEEILPVDQNQKAITNPATQTLFRFVSLRNPQLAESKNNIGFITRPRNIKGEFDTAIEAWTGNPTKFQILEQVAFGFEAGAFEKEKDVEDFSPKYYKLGKSLAKNETLDLTGSYPEIDLSKLWNNLIYQVVTQKDFYVKEAIIQTLKAVHYYRYSDESTSELARNAKVVLPAKLFVEEASIEDEQDQLFTVERTEIGSDDQISAQNQNRVHQAIAPKSMSVIQESRLKVNADKNLLVTNALLKKAMLQNLKKELEKLQKSYSKSYHKSYENALANYQREVHPIIISNDEIVDQLEATFDANTVETAKKSAYRQLELADVPKFEFTYKNEINFPDLQSKLNADSFNLFLELFTEYDAEAIKSSLVNRITENSNIISDTEMKIHDTAVVLSEDYLSYQEIFAKVDEEISAQSKIALSVVEMPKQQYVKIGGVLVPISKNTSTTPGGYSLMAYYKASIAAQNSFLTFSFEVENDSWSLAYAKVIAVADGTEKEQTLSNLPVVDGKITLPATLLNQFINISSVKIELYFDNGKEAVLEFDEVINNQSYTGIFDFTSGGKVAAKYSDVASANTFIPKRFGVRRLGIADYLKVEQSVHAYVPGEVSNIENVMASELRHKSSTKSVKTEDTQTESTSTETEHISDTTTATRNEMQSEVSKVLQEDRDIQSHANWSKDTKLYGRFEVGGSYASHTSKETATRQAVENSQEVTNRALDRIVSKISEERVRKITNEFVEENIHEFDNRDGKEHISGVYRWVDKKMKNQIYNYGKRMMFEFMIPEPARLHRLANAGEILTAPQDPRKATDQWKMANAGVDETVLQHWADVYNVKLTETPVKTLNQHIDYEWFKLDEDESQRFKTLNIPENYAMKSVTVYYGYEHGTMKVSNFKGGDMYLAYVGGSSIDSSYTVNDINIENSFAFKYQGFGVDSFNVTFDFVCGLSDTYINSWKQLQFDNIIAAYTQAEADFQKIKEEQEAEQTDKTQNFYRDMEEVVLKHNCIAYLLQDYLTVMGRQSTDGTRMDNFQVMLDADLDSYAALVKFMEQAMEWTIMDYTFYPYYWAERKNWQEMYITESVDPLFRNFLQAGMGRVIVTVKPGFEDAIQFFMNTGRIWNGGEVPVIGDPMYLSIVDELREPAGKPQGKAWITRIPTTLNILQARSIGLEVVDALPISNENPKDFEVPSEVETSSAFGKPKDVVLTGSTKPTTLSQK